MNTSNQKLIRGIKIFFKTIQIILIVFLSFYLLGEVLMLTVLKDYDMGTLSIIKVDMHPDTTVMIHGEEHEVMTFVGFGGVNVKGVPLSLRIVNILFMVASLLMYFLILRTIRSIVKAIEKSDIFSVSNIKRLKFIGYLMISGFVIENVLIILNSSVTNTITENGLGGAIGFVIGKSLGYLVAIAFTFFMAGVFRIGVNMQEENQSFV